METFEGAAGVSCRAAPDFQDCIDYIALRRVRFCKLPLEAASGIRAAANVQLHISTLRNFINATGGEIGEKSKGPA